MSSASVTQAVREILGEQLGLATEDVELTDTLRDDLGIDSLDLFELQNAFEERFCVRLDDKQLLQLHTVQDVIDHIWKALPEVTQLT